MLIFISFRTVYAASLCIFVLEPADRWVFYVLFNGAISFLYSISVISFFSFIYLLQLQKFIMYSYKAIVRRILLIAFHSTLLS